MATLDEILNRDEEIMARPEGLSTVRGKFLSGIRERAKSFFQPKDTFGLQQEAFEKGFPEKTGALGFSPTSVKRSLEDIFKPTKEPYKVRRAFEVEPIETKAPPIIGKVLAPLGFFALEAIPRAATILGGEFKAGFKPAEVKTNINLRRLGFETPNYITAAKEQQDAINKGENPWISGLRIVSNKTLDLAFGAQLVSDLAKLSSRILLKGGVEARIEAQNVLDAYKTHQKETFARLKNAPLEQREKSLADITNTKNQAEKILKEQGAPTAIDRARVNTARYTDVIAREGTPVRKGFAERFMRPDISPKLPSFPKAITPPAGELPGYRARPGQAPAFGLSIKEIEPVGFGKKVLRNNISGEEFNVISQGEKISTIKSLKTGEQLNIPNIDLQNKFTQEVKSVTPEKFIPPETISEEIKSISDIPEEKIRIPIEEKQPIQNTVKIENINVDSKKALGLDKTSRDLAAEIKENVLRYNRDKISDEQIRKIREINLLGKESIDEIILRKRGIVSDKQALERAKLDKRTIEDILNIPQGSVATKEQLTAVSQIIQSEREINSKLRQLIDGGGLAQTKDERMLLQELDIDLGKLSDHELLNRALAESTLKLRKAEIIMLGLRAETGRALQSMKQIVGSVDSRMKVIFDRIKRLPSIEQQAIIEQIADVKLDDDKEFLKFLDKISESDYFDKLAEYSTAAKLWNPTTHIVNLGGNTIRQIVDIGLTTAMNPMAARVDVAGAIKGLDIGLKNSLKAITNENYARELSKYIEEGGKSSAISGWLGKAVRIPFRLLAASDEIFRTMGFQRSLYRQAYGISKKEGLKGAELKKRMEELLNTPTFKMIDKATEQGKKLTFQEDLGEIAKKVEHWRQPSAFQSKLGKTTGLLFRFFVPFLKTPVNLLKQAVDFSPFGLGKNFRKMKQAAKEGDKEKVGQILGEAILGSLILAWTHIQILNGNITGGVPKEAKAKDEFYREKKLPYSIKIGDKWYQYKRIDPFATVMGAYVDMVNLSKKEAVKVTSYFTVLMNQMSDKTYLKGVSDFVTLLTGEDWEKENVFRNMILGAILPSILGHTARSIDPTVRDTRNIVENLKARIPGVSEELPARVNVLGEDIERANKGLNFFFNPIQSIDAEIDPVTEELLRIDYQIPIPERYFTRDKIRYDLTGEEYADYAKFVGTSVKDGILDLIESSSYKRLSEEKQIKKIEKIRDDATKEWKDSYLKQGEIGEGKKSLEEIFQ